MSATPASHTPEAPLSPADSNDGEDLGPPQTSIFLRHISQTARQLHGASLDHLYSRAWGWRTDGNPAQQARTLLVNPISKTTQQLDNPNIDVESVDEPRNLTDEDEAAAIRAMEECSEHVAAARDVPDDLIEQLDQSSWSSGRRQLLRRVLAALDSYQLARRAAVGRRGAAFVARAAADRCAGRVRRALAEVGWERPLCQWLQTLLLQKLGKEMLALYLEVLQTLASKVPSLVGRLSAAPGVARHGPLSSEALAPLLRRPWDPAAHLISQHKLKRLPNNPLLVVVPSSPCHADISARGQQAQGAGRRAFWHRQLSLLGKVVSVSECEGGAPVRGISVSESLSHILSTSRQQVSELRRPGRPLILLGWGAAGLVAAHLALVEPVSAVVALGFPIWSPAGRRGEPDDPLLELKTPVLMVVGQAAADAAPREVEMMREKMKALTALVVVGGADERLLVTGRKKQREGLTQSMVDRAILEEISEFLTGVLSEPTDGRRPAFSRLPTPPLTRQEGTGRGAAREKRRKAAGAAAGDGSAATQPTKRRAGKQLRPGRPKKMRSRSPSTIPESDPTPPTPTPASTSTPSPAPVPATTTTTTTAPAPLPTPTPTSAPAASAESPIIDLIHAVEPEVDADVDVDVDVDVVTTELDVGVERTVTVLRPSQPGQGLIKMVTTPTLKSQGLSFASSQPSAAGSSGLPSGAAYQAGWRGGGRGGGRPKFNQKQESAPKRPRGRGRARARGQPRYGVAHDFSRPLTLVPPLPGPAGPAADSARGEPRPQTTIPERPPAPQPQQLVYVQPPPPTPRPSPLPTPERLLVMSASGGTVSRQLVAAGGRARTVTYVPSGRQPEQQHAAGQARLVRPGSFVATGRGWSVQRPPRPG